MESTYDQKCAFELRSHRREGSPTNLTALHNKRSQEFSKELPPTVAAEGCRSLQFTLLPLIRHRVSVCHTTWQDLRLQITDMVAWFTRQPVQFETHKGTSRSNVSQQKQGLMHIQLEAMLACTSRLLWLTEVGSVSNAVGRPYFRRRVA